MDVKTWLPAGQTTWMLLALLLVTPPAARADLLSVADRAPGFTARILDGERLRFPRDLHDRPVLVLFWATWCPYCKALMPRLARLQEEFADSGLEVLALNMAEPGDPATEIRARGLPFLFVPAGDDAAARYRVQMLPGLFLVVDGRIRYVLDYPPEDHPSQRLAHGPGQAANLAAWWEERIRGVLQAEFRTSTGS